MSEGPIGSDDDGRHALIIAATRYDDSALKPLPSVADDVDNLAAMLADPAVGGWNVHLSLNQTEDDPIRDIYEVLMHAGRSDSVLIYLIGHAVNDARDGLCF